VLIFDVWQVLADDAANDDTQTSIRQCILGFFRGFDAETLPPPATDSHVMQNIENPLYHRDISAEFLQKVEYVRKRSPPASSANGFCWHQFNYQQTCTFC